MPVIVLVAAPREIAGLPPGAEVVPLTEASTLTQALEGCTGAVVVSDGFPPPALNALAAAARQAVVPVIEVRAERWDGQSPSPLSAACRGVISGFGDAGIRAAVELLLAGA